MHRVYLARLMVPMVLYAGLASADAAGPTHAALRAELLKMAASDQEVRRQARQGDVSRWADVDAANQARLKQIVAQSGWPTIAMVGEDGATAAWLIAQHADGDRAFQRRVLALMEVLVPQGQASRENLAYLVDRTHSPQRYGTQGRCVSSTEWRPLEIVDAAGVDARRGALGLEPLADYVASMGQACANWR